VSWGFVEKRTIFDAVRVAGPDPRAIFAQGTDALRAVRERLSDADAVAFDSVRLLAPVVRSSMIIGVGLNYRDHAAESGMRVPDEPVIFSKLPSSILEPGGTIKLPAASSSVDWEAELGIVIGRTAKDVDESDALDHVIGYTIVNDISARDLQVRDGQWVRAKSFDSFCPVGPWISTEDEIGDGAGLTIELSVNGVNKQRSTTSNLIAGVRRLVAYCSSIATLEPGDLITTGTPGGVGVSRTPPEFLQAGDEVVVDIEWIGSLRNVVA
jgi:2-keto-4-pentenoate hydratase/2-oxohepta-3-ene-1,7-dioic acid hydratase in catechol pathway